MTDPYKIIKYPLGTEKAIRLMNNENKLIFIVEKKTNKFEIKEAVENLFKVKVLRVNTLIMPTGKKRAYVRLSPDNLARDVATQLGMI
jgi:large subunit ribosomal protein L23